MTLFFNIRTLVSESKGDPHKLVDLLKRFKEKRIYQIGLRNKLIGGSFLLNPDAILNDKTTDILYIYQYILLASKRDYALLTLYGIKSLPIISSLNLNSIRNNPLLEVTKTEIHLKYEE